MHMLVLRSVCDLTATRVWYRLAPAEHAGTKQTLLTGLKGMGTGTIGREPDGTRALTDLSIRMASVFLSFSSQVSFSSAMIFSDSYRTADKEGQHILKDHLEVYAG